MKFAAFLLAGIGLGIGVAYWQIGGDAAGDWDTGLPLEQQAPIERRRASPAVLAFQIDGLSQVRFRRFRIHREPPSGQTPVPRLSRRQKHRRWRSALATPTREYRKHRPIPPISTPI